MQPYKDPLEDIKVSVKKTEQKPKEESFIKELVKFAIISFVIVFPIRAFVAEPFIVSGSSMDPTFHTGNYLIVDRISYRFEEPQRGEVIIFRYPKDTTKYFIKRIIGLPGETLEMRGTDVIIKNAQHPEGFKIDESYVTPERQKPDNFSITLKEGEYFVMGDNRAASADSRLWGTLPKKLIVGRAILRLFPTTSVSVFPGNHNFN